MADDDADRPFYKNFIIVLIVVGSSVFFVASMYRVLVIWFCYQQSTTTDQNPPHPPRFAATPNLGENTSSSIVNLIPTHKYHKKNKLDIVSDEEGGTCAVCLGDFEEGEELRTMPVCLHSFHVRCIDMWLHSHLNCPVCRSSAAPSPAVNAHHHSIDMSRLMRW